MTSKTLECGSHDCSCSVRDVGPFEDTTQGGWGDRADGKADEIFAWIFANTTSHLTLDDKHWDLSAPPLLIGLKTYFFEEMLRTSYKDAADYWSNSTGRRWSTLPLTSNEFSEYPNTMYWYNGTAFDAATIARTGRCVSEDQYQWDFSSLLLLTFCAFTTLFASTLILLQTDVYWNSRNDRDHQSHSLYTDILYVAEELGARFHGNAAEHVRSPKAFERQVEGSKERLYLEVHELPLSRWQERKMLRAAEKARKNEAPRRRSQSSAGEARVLNYENSEHTSSRGPA